METLNKLESGSRKTLRMPRRKRRGSLLPAIRLVDGGARSPDRLAPRRVAPEGQVQG